MEDTATALGPLSIRDLLARLASSEPVPGGGSASALAGALGASLVAMVSELSLGRGSPHDEGLRDARDAAIRLQADLLRLAERDAAAYDGVVRARRLPRADEPQRRARQVAMAEAMRHAADVPLATARAALDALALCGRVAPIGNPNAISDAGVAAHLAAAAVRGAILNVRINLPHLPTDEPLRLEAPAELHRLAERAAQLEDEVTGAVAQRMTPT